MTDAHDETKYIACHAEPSLWRRWRQALFDNEETGQVALVRLITGYVEETENKNATPDDVA